MLRENGRINEAIKILKPGLTKFPTNKPIKDNLILAYIKKANALRDNKIEFKTVELDYKKAEQLDSNNEWVLLNYGYFLILKGDHEKAIKLLEKGRRTYPANLYFKGNIIVAYYEYARKKAEQKKLDQL